MTPYDYALLAQEAYTAPPDIGREDSASRAIVRQTDAGLVVAFPGTDNIPCWMSDLDIRTTTIDGAGAVHLGFWLAWQAISGEVMQTIGDQSVTLVGHSLGAAIAIMAAVSLTLAGKPPALVYGFEPPRVAKGLGVAALLRSVDVRLFKNGGDVVPDLPPLMNHAALLIPIGKPCLPNVPDHYLDHVLPSLQASQAAEN